MSRRLHILGLETAGVSKTGPGRGGTARMDRRSSRRAGEAAGRGCGPRRDASDGGAGDIEVESVGAAVVVVDGSGSVVRVSGWEKVANAPAPSRIPPGDDLPDQLLEGIAAAIDEARRLCGPTRR